MIAARGLSQAEVEAARAAVAAAGGVPGPPMPVDGRAAIDFSVAGLEQPAARAALEAAARAHGIDAVVQPGRPGVLRARRLLVADMDSTIIGQECLDELGALAGRGAEIAAVTARAMRGEVDFAEALRARVAALAGLEAGAIARVLAERVRLSPGARTLVCTMRALGARTVLVSGGFTAFSAEVARRAGFDAHVANRLGVEGGRLSGRVAEPIVDAAAKRGVLETEARALGLSAPETLAVGDGANDIPMLEAAGLGIAWRAKPTAEAAADAAIRAGDLSAILWAQGIPRARWVEQPADEAAARPAPAL